MAGVPPSLEDAWSTPSESIDVVRLRGEVNTQYAELRGDLKTNSAETNAKIDRIDERLGSIRWIFALAIPVAIALTILVFAVVSMVLES